MILVIHMTQQLKIKCIYVCVCYEMGSDFIFIIL